jgi:hypothetical protein
LFLPPAFHVSSPFHHPCALPTATVALQSQLYFPLVSRAEILPHFADVAPLRATFLHSSPYSHWLSLDFYAGLHLSMFSTSCSHPSFRQTTLQDHNKCKGRTLYLKCDHEGA